MRKRWWRIILDRKKKEWIFTVPTSGLFLKYPLNICLCGEERVAGMQFLKIKSILEK